MVTGSQWEQGRNGNRVAMGTGSQWEQGRNGNRVAMGTGITIDEMISKIAMVTGSKWEEGCRVQVTSYKVVCGLGREHELPGLLYLLQ
jgi:hypothetical protein